MNGHLYLTVSWAGHLYIKHYLSFILSWTWRPVRTVGMFVFKPNYNSIIIHYWTLIKACTFHMRSYLGWTRAVHPEGSFPCLRCGSKRRMAHAPILQSGFRHFQPRPRSGHFDSCLHLHLFGLQQPEPLAGLSEPPVPLCSHSAPALPRSLGKGTIKRGRKRRN